GPRGCRCKLSGRSREAPGCPQRRSTNFCFAIFVGSAAQTIIIERRNRRAVRGGSSLSSQPAVEQLTARTLVVPTGALEADSAAAGKPEASCSSGKPLSAKEPRD